MQKVMLIVFSHVFRKYVNYPIDLVPEVLRLLRFRSVRQYVILSTTHRLPTHYLLCYNCTQKVRYLLCLQNLIIISCDCQTQSFHSTMLPNLQMSVYRALTTFETAISSWMDPSKWLDANMKHIRSVFDGIVGSTENANMKAMPFPASPIFQVC